MEIAGQKVIIPIWINMKAEKIYFESYEKDKNYRKAFCNLIFAMIDVKGNITDDKVIELESIELIPDDDLIKLMNLYLEKEELKSYFKEYFKEDYFEAFYSVHKRQWSEMGRQVSKSIGNMTTKISDSMKPLLKIIGNMGQLTLPSIDSGTEKLIKHDNLFLDYKIGSMPDMLPTPINPQHKTNGLLSELNKNIINLRQNEREYQLQNNEYSLRMVELLSKEQEARENLEKSTKKADKRNIVTNIIIITIALLTLIATIIGIMISMDLIII
ncbi:hypothetical protein [Clostridium lacusfryxellense]|uniref:hypothetical protein n=1 Tax=Clostridium lacusfryxellense TaxID=205328 RepID=UPI001C0B1F4D|nr:hypothetical protein [Clostridium lacusfryxellense]MBU3112131.1 hypothetical protein [Clostridium lacusfryxellense]